MIFAPYGSVLDLARDLERQNGHRPDPPDGCAASGSVPRRVLGALRSVARRWPRAASTPATGTGPTAGSTAKSRVC